MEEEEDPEPRREQRLKKGLERRIKCHLLVLLEDVWEARQSQKTRNEEEMSQTAPSVKSTAKKLTLTEKDPMRQRGGKGEGKAEATRKEFRELTEVEESQAL